MVPMVVHVFRIMMAVSDTLGPLIQLHKGTPPTVVLIIQSGTVRTVMPIAARMMWNSPRGSFSQTTDGQAPKVIVLRKLLITPSLW